MDDRRFDALTRQLGQGGSRRTLLKTLIGLGGVAATSAILRDTDAARRGYSGPPTLAPLTTRTAQPTLVPTQTAQPTSAPTQTAQPTNTPNSCGPSGVCCTVDSDCWSIPTYCESTQDGLYWRYHLCGGGISGPYCIQTAHKCDALFGGVCAIAICDDQTGCAEATVPPGQVDSSGLVCCTDDSHCAGLPRYCDGGDWHYYQCDGRACRQRVRACGTGQCQEPIGCQVFGPG